MSLTTVSYFDAANKLKQEGKLEEAIASYRQAIGENSNFYWSYHNLGETLAKLGRWEEAIDAYSRALDLAKVIAMYRRTIELNHGSVEAYQALVKLQPESWELWWQLGQVLEQNNRLEEAIAAYQTTIVLNTAHIPGYQALVKLQPESWELWWQLGQLLEQNNRLEEAIAAYQTTIVLNTAHIPGYQALVKLQPESWELWWQLGQLLEQNNQREEAITAYQKVIEMNQENPEAHLQSYEKIFKLQPELIDTELYYKLAVGLRQQGHIDKAVAYYRKAVGFNPDNCKIDNGLAEILRMRSYQDLAEAKSIDARIIGANKDTDTNPMQLQLLYNLISNLSTESITDLEFDIITPVWGESYTETYINIVLPTLLTPGNLLAFRITKQPVYKIYTTVEDAETIINSPAYFALKEILKVDIKAVVERNPGNAYGTMTLCHNEAIIEADKEDRYLVFLPPDTIWAEHSFTNMIKIAKTGKRAIMLPGILLCKDVFIPALSKKFDFSRKFNISIDARELVKLCLEHLHLEVKSFFASSLLYSSVGPAHIYWRVKDKGLLARCFVLHPLMVKPHKKDVFIKNTLDMEYVSEICSIDEIYVVEDSDEICFCDLTELGHRENNVTQITGKSREVEIAKWASQWTNQHHREYFSKHRIRIHADDIDEDWHKIEHESDEVVAKIMNHITENSSIVSNLSEIEE